MLLFFLFVGFVHCFHLWLLILAISASVENQQIFTILVHSD